MQWAILSVFIVALFWWPMVALNDFVGGGNMFAFINTPIVFGAAALFIGAVVYVCLQEFTPALFSS